MSRASPLRGRYLVRNPAFNAALRLSDGVLGMLVRARKPEPASPPRRVLVAIGGHLGDAVIATSVLPEIARRYPGAEIGMLLPSWSAQVVRGHSRIRWIHIVDHWKMSRRGGGVAEKVGRYARDARRAVREMREVGYDVAIDLYAYYPNAAALLWNAGIPVRVGYTSGGNGPLYTRAIDWSATAGHTVAQHVRLLAAWDSGFAATNAPRYDLPPITPSAYAAARRLLAMHAVAPGSYVVAHPGTGAPEKAWPAEQWIDAVSRLMHVGFRVVFTGAGARERAQVRALAQMTPGSIDLCDALDWAAYRALIADARLVIGPDSVATHVAAAERVPSITIMSAIRDPEWWRPLGDEAVVLRNETPCAPCFKKHGCATMDCVRGVPAAAVVNAALSSLIRSEANAAS